MGGASIGFGIFGGLQVFQNVKYYGNNNTSMRGKVPHVDLDFGFALLLDIYGGTLPRTCYTVIIFIVKLNLGRCLTLIFQSFRIEHFEINCIV